MMDGGVDDTRSQRLKGADNHMSVNTSFLLRLDQASPAGPGLTNDLAKAAGSTLATEVARPSRPISSSARPLPLLCSLALDGSPRGIVSCAAQFLAKQLIDMVVSALALLILSPLMLAIALIIRLDSKGPVLFRQQRQGLGGRPFWMCKFRTMSYDAEERMRELEHLNESQGGVLFKIRRDPRVTRVGRFLRRTSLDELPQLNNVLMGHMSLVGPRPLPLRDSELLRKRDEELYARRLSVLPGVSGPWQVAGRSQMGTDEMLDLDLDYIDNWSLWWDLRLLARTFFVVLIGRGSY